MVEEATTKAPAEEEATMREVEEAVVVIKATLSLPALLQLISEASMKVASGIIEAAEEEATQEVVDNNSGSTLRLVALKKILMKLHMEITSSEIWFPLLEWFLTL